MNPFRIPNAPNGETAPLCPWDYASHENLYAPVDHTAVAFETFTSAMANANSLESYGGVVLIEGLPGCGKTSLMHRCANWLNQKLQVGEAQEGQVSILDLTNDSLDGADKETRIAFLYRRVLDEIELNATFAREEIADLTRRDNPDQGYPFLSRLLKNNSKNLLILLPDCELAPEIIKYCSLARERIVFFCETSSNEVRSFFGSSIANGLKPSIRLQVGTLEVQDGWTFVKSRLALYEGTSAAKTINIDEGSITQFMTARISGRAGRTNLLELHKTCLAVYDEAVRQSQETIDYSDFADYYMREAFLQ